VVAAVFLGEWLRYAFLALSLVADWNAGRQGRLLFGLCFGSSAKSAGLTYTHDIGDEPAISCRSLEFVRSMASWDLMHRWTAPGLMVCLLMTE